MRQHAWTRISAIAKKELKRVFGDRRMLATIFLPGVLIYLIYTLMGGMIGDALTVDENYVYHIRVEHLPESTAALLSATGSTWHFEEEPAEEVQIKQALQDQDLDLYVVFPEHFDEDVAAYDAQMGVATGKHAPHVSIYFNSTSTTSTAAYQLLTTVMNQYESSLANKFDINANPDQVYDLADETDMTGMIFSMLMPFFLVFFAFAGCLALVPESIAGEKERGTIATLLVTPVRRSELAIGKIVSLSAVAMLSGLCSFIGVLLALPKLMSGVDEGILDVAAYGVGDYLCALGVILSTVLVFSALLSIVSAYANSVKEATGLATPLMILVMLVGMSGMFQNMGLGGGAAPSTPMFLIPVYNSVQCLSGVFSFSYQPVAVLLTIVSNIAAALLLTWVVSRMFRSEKILFRK